MEFAFRSCNPLQRTLNDCYRRDSVSRILQASYKSEYRSLLPPSFSRREAVHPVSAAFQPSILPVPCRILNQSILPVLSSPVFAYTELRSAIAHLRTASSPRPLRVLSDLCVKIPPSLDLYPSATPKTSTHPRNSRRMNTCKTASKQMTLTIFRMNTYVKTGGKGRGASQSLTPPRAVTFPSDTPRVSRALSILLVTRHSSLATVFSRQSFTPSLEGPLSPVPTTFSFSQHACYRPHRRGEFPNVSE
jgi:hypothetical protein